MNKVSKQMMLAAFAVAGFSGSLATADLVDYFESAAQIFPNKLKIGAFQEFRYDDNVNHAPKGDELDSFISKTGISVDIFREQGNYNYGVKGDVSYNYYDHRSSDYNYVDWTITPHIAGNFGMRGGRDNLRISLTSRNRRERYDAANTEHVRHMSNALGLDYDMNVNDRVGVIFSADYKWDYYSQDEYKDRSKQNYGFSIAPYYIVSEKTKVGVKARYSATKYRNDKYANDSHSWDVGAFVDYKISSALFTSLEAGMRQKNYKGAADDSNKDSSWMSFVSAALNYKMNSNLAFRFRTHLGTEDSSSGRGLRDKWSNVLSAQWKVNEKLSFVPSVGYIVSDEKNYSDDTEEYVFDFRANYDLNDNISLYAGYKYDLVEFKYNGFGCDDYDSNEVYVGLRWNFK
ncbi:MAG: outer membrane beta-barrel protein [Victivallales bacterium]|nr:outer membrane beta-barrel protein [Victivallales bacterium]